MVWSIDIRVFWSDFRSIIHTKGVLFLIDIFNLSFLTFQPGNNFFIIQKGNFDCAGVFRMIRTCYYSPLVIIFLVKYL